MKNKCFILTISLLMAFPMVFIVNAQSSRANSDYVSEIVIAKEKEGKLTPTLRFNQNTNIELDFKEQCYIIVRKQNAQMPYDPLCFESLIKEVQVETAFQGKIYEPIVKRLTCADSPIPSNFPFKCLDFIPEEVKSKLNSSNINELKMTVRLKWYKTTDICIGSKQVFPTDLTTDRVDVFTIDVKHFGLLVLVDLNPVAQAGNTAQFWDILKGIAYNLSYTGIDYAYISKDNNFTTALITTPVIRVEGRGWLNKNVEGQFTLVKDLNSTGTYLGYGGGLGLFGDTKIIKTGVFWYNKESPHFYVGVSLIGLAKWLTKNNDF